MLVLSRKINEEIVTNGPCTITLIDIDRGKARLGFVADKSVKVMRSELLECGKPMPSPVSSERYAADLDKAAELLQRVHWIGTVKAIGRLEVVTALEEIVAEVELLRKRPIGES
jgi:carbon storage regulator CsrA